MSKYFNTFETQAEFDAAEIGCPSVSLVKEDIRCNGQYGPQIQKIENLNTGEITYVYESLA